MKHLGDITKIKGWEITPVNVISGGSPCQDLSVAGLRKGLTTDDGELTRSGLFMEQERVVREMLNATEGMYPRFQVWENVPGALTSGVLKDESGKVINRGTDFAAVLEEMIKVKYPNIPPIPIPKKGWTTAGYITVGDMSLAWRVHDGQYFGCPQRRRRICVLADYQSYKASDILFGPMSDTPKYAPAKGKKDGAVVYCLPPSLYGDLAWAEDAAFPIYNYNISEKPACGQTPLWDRYTGFYTNMESILSNILETFVDIKYYLSAKACRGILSRAARRGKTLPEELRIALEQQIERFENEQMVVSDEEECQ